MNSCPTVDIAEAGADAWLDCSWMRCSASWAWWRRSRSSFSRLRRMRSARLRLAGLFEDILFCLARGQIKVTQDVPNIGRDVAMRSLSGRENEESKAPSRRAIIGRSIIMASACSKCLASSRGHRFIYLSEG